MRIFAYYIVFLLSVFSKGGDDLKKIAEEKLKQKLGDVKRVEVFILTAPNLAGKVEIDDENDIKINGDKCYIPATITDKNTRKKAIITATMKIYKDVYIAAKDIKKGEELSEEDFIVKECEIASLRTMPLGDLNEIRNYRAKINIKSGEILSRNHIEKKPLVKRGDKLTGVFESSYVQISLTVYAREDGGAEDIIRVITPEKRIYKAQILNEQTVKIIGE